MLKHSDLDFQKLIDRAKSYFKKKGGNIEEANDFAQELAITAYTKGIWPNLEYCYQDYRKLQCANKRILGNFAGSFTETRTISLAAPIKSSTESSATIQDFIGDKRNVLEEREQFTDLERDYKNIIRLARSGEARKWAEYEFRKWLVENVI